MAEHELNKIVDDDGEVFNLRDPSKATTSLGNVTSSAINNLYSATDGRSGHSNLAAGYGLLATINTTNLGGYSDIHAVFEIYDLAANSNYNGKRVVVVNIRNNSATAGAGSYVYKINQLIYEPVSARLSIKAFRTNYDDVRLYSVGMGSGMYGGVVCKLVSCTGYAGVATYDKVTLSKSTASSSIPSGTEISISTETNPSVNSLVRDYRSIPEDVSKGANLVVNGSGRMASNYNFSNFLYVPTISYGGSAGSFGYSSTYSEDEYISCDFNKKVVFSADVKNLVAQPSNCVHRLFVLEFDIDKKSINAMHVMYGVGTLTELTQDLNPGDTVVHLADLSNANWLSETTHHRGFIFWNYQNSYGYFYPPETYSRNVYPSDDHNPLWDVANVNVSAGTITLNSGWTGPTIPAGTKVSRRSSGNTYPYPTTVTTGDTEWHSIKGYMKGVSSPGTSERSSAKFSQGTAFIKAGIYPSNLNNTDPVINKRAVVTNFAIYEEQDINDGFGTLPVNRGGTGKTSVTAGSFLVGNGTNALAEKTPNVAANDLINALSTGESTPTGEDYYVAQFAGGGTTTKTYHRRPIKALWEYIKAQISSVLGLTATSYGGNAATATALASGGADRTKLDGIAAGAEVNVQSDWNQTTTTADDYIKNKPQNLVQDASYVHTDNNYTTADKNKVASAVQPGNVGLTDYYDIDVTTSTGGVVDNDTYAAISASISAGRMVYLKLDDMPLYRYLDTNSGDIWFASPYETVMISPTAGTGGHEFTLKPLADDKLSILSTLPVQSKVVKAALDSLTASDVGAMRYYSALSEISGSLTSASTIVQVVSAMDDGSALVAEVSSGTFSDKSFGPASGRYGTITIVRRSKYRAYATFVGKDDGIPSTCSVVADTSSYTWDNGGLRITSGSTEVYGFKIGGTNGLSQYSSGTYSFDVVLVSSDQSPGYVRRFSLELSVRNNTVQCSFFAVGHRVGGGSEVPVIKVVKKSGNYNYDFYLLLNGYDLKKPYVSAVVRQIMPVSNFNYDMTFLTSSFSETAVSSFTSSTQIVPVSSLDTSTMEAEVLYCL